MNREQLFFSLLPEEIIYRILDYLSKNDLCRFDDAITNHTLREIWINFKKIFLRIFRKIIICDQTFFGHKERVLTLIELSDGRIASGGDDKTIKIWNMETGMCEQQFEGHFNAVLKLIQLNNGKIASGSKDLTIKIWNLVSGECERTIHGHRDWATNLIELKDGRIGSCDFNRICLWDIVNEKRKCLETGTSGPICTLMDLGDGKILSASSDNVIQIWNSHGVVERSFVKSFSKGLDLVLAFIKLTDGRLAMGCYNKTIKIGYIETGIYEETSSDHSNRISALIQLKDGRLASGSWDKTIIIWNATNWSPELTLLGHRDSVAAVIQLKDGRIASGSWDNTVKIWSSISL